eukprot:6137263-Ditylum_brightwellii.AAC.1
MSLYPTHADALKKANIFPKKIPMVHKVYKQELAREEMQKKKAEEKKRRQDKRTIYFVIGHAHFWAKFHIARIIKSLAKNSNSLTSDST